MFMQFKMQIACILVLLVIGYSNSKEKRLNTISSRIFNKIFIVSLINLAFDIATVYTVNNQGTVGPFLNHLCHQIFIFSLDLFAYWFYRYMVSYIETEHPQSFLVRTIHRIPLVVSGIVIIFGPIDYKLGLETSYSAGWPVLTVHICVGIYFLIATYYNIRYWKTMSRMKREALIQSLLISVAITIVQAMNPSLLISGLAITLVIVIVYTSMENPGEYIEKQSGVFNRYGLVRMVNEKLAVKQKFTVLTIVLDDYDEYRGSSDQQYRYRAVAAIDEYIQLFFKLDAYHTMDNGVNIIIPDNKSVGRIQDDLEHKFENTWNIDGTLKRLKVHITRIVCPDDAATDAEILGRISQDVNASATQMAYQDSLTGVKNRNAYEKEIAQLFIDREKYSSIFCIMIDINNLKTINDTKGHGMGDILIKSTAKVLLDATRGKDDIYRIGGDEFVVIMTDVLLQDTEGVLHRIEMKRLALNENSPITIDFALGHSLYNEMSDESLSDMVKRADAMMYENKKLMKALR